MLRVIRVGGSLLTWDGLPAALARWLDGEPNAVSVLMAGGGEWVDLLREAADRFSLSDESAHWMCVRAMSVTAQLLHELLPNSLMSKDLDHVRSLGRTNSQATNMVFDAEVFLGGIEPSSAGEALPRNWDVTSDSIAARLAEVLPASELVLLKSRLPDPACSTLQGLCDTEYTDRHFARAAGPLKHVRCVDLRSVEFSEWSWTSQATFNDS